MSILKKFGHQCEVLRETVNIFKELLVDIGKIIIEGLEVFFRILLVITVITTSCSMHHQEKQNDLSNFEEEVGLLPRKNEEKIMNSSTFSEDHEVNRDRNRF